MAVRHYLAALLMFGTAFAATVLRMRNRLWAARRFHAFVLWTTPAGVLGILGGWVTAEAGRQPWVVFGQLRTSEAVSRLASGEVLFSVIGFSALYLGMLAAYIAYVVRTMRIGPERDDPRRQPSPEPPDLTLLESADVPIPAERRALLSSPEVATR
ncbi:cytochrome ubiquinol oxidase subunit I [Pseudofrankia sp. BMG5.36]|uniref:cytochrome ubiquinol oxidase subunit I n=1 Tax=Pseudofrankia sp. BMG5.36 TaxID=1834512 RepID=UPI0008D8DDA6|nr:cytochrome ubiquinol oxidase subunit I [Pseudofrankia sp. BMG5.36]OHV71745.1 hypothetical protein BCD48_34115 [Pseudofrankia sp. BMG5.36]